MLSVRLLTFFQVTKAKCNFKTSYGDKKMWSKMTQFKVVQNCLKWQENWSKMFFLDF